MCVCVCIKQKLKKQYIYHNAQRKAHAHSIDHAHLSHLSRISFSPRPLGPLDHHVGESVHRRAEAVEHRQPGFDRIDSSLSMSLTALLRTGRRRRRRRGRGHQRRGRRRRSGHWRVVVVATIDGTSRRRCREVEGTLNTVAVARAGRRRRRECGAALLGEEAGHRRRGR